MAHPELDCFIMDSNPPEMIPARSRRDWMDNSPDRYAYRCLPLTMANSTGWEILCPFELRLEWNGNNSKESLKLSSPDRKANVAAFATSHFGQGIVTFHTGYLFRTPPGWAVWTMGPPNAPKDGLQALTGLVETDWLPFPFTMNWKMTRPGRVRFRKGEPFCFLTLTEHHQLEGVTPKLRRLDDDPELLADYKAWQTSREGFLNKLAQNDPDVVKQGWQRNYMKGEKPTGEVAPENHITKRRLKAPE